MTVIKLATSQERKPVHACGTCKHYRDRDNDPYLAKCRAFGTYVTTARSSERFCGSAGNYWEPIPPTEPGLFRAIWIFFFGEKRGR